MGPPTSDAAIPITPSSGCRAAGPSWRPETRGSTSVVSASRVPANARRVVTDSGAGPPPDTQALPPAQRPRHGSLEPDPSDNSLGQSWGREGARGLAGRA